MTMPGKTRRITGATELTEPVDRKPRRGRMIGEVPTIPSLEGWIAAMVTTVVTAIALYGPLPKGIDIAVLAIAILSAGFGVWKLRNQSRDPQIGWVRSLGFAARAVGFRGDLIVAAGDQLAVIRRVAWAPMKISRTGEVSLGGKPLHRLAPSQEAKALARATGAKVDMIVAVDDTDGRETEPVLAPLGRGASVMVVPLQGLAGVVLGLPARMDETTNAVTLVTDWCGKTL